MGRRGGGLHRPARPDPRRLRRPPHGRLAVRVRARSAPGRGGQGRRAVVNDGAATRRGASTADRGRRSGSSRRRRTTGPLRARLADRWATGPTSRPSAIAPGSWPHTWRGWPAMLVPYVTATPVRLAAVLRQRGVQGCCCTQEYEEGSFDVCIAARAPAARSRCSPPSREATTPAPGSSGLVRRRTVRAAAGLVVARPAGGRRGFGIATACALIGSPASPTRSTPTTVPLVDRAAARAALGLPDRGPGRRLGTDGSTSAPKGIDVLRGGLAAGGGADARRRSRAAAWGPGRGRGWLGDAIDELAAATTCCWRDEHVLDRQVDRHMALGPPTCTCCPSRQEGFLVVARRGHGGRAGGGGDRRTGGAGRGGRRAEAAGGVVVARRTPIGAGPGAGPSFLADHDGAAGAAPPVVGRIGGRRSASRWMRSGLALRARGDRAERNDAGGVGDRPDHRAGRDLLEPLLGVRCWPATLRPKTIVVVDQSGGTRRRRRCSASWGRRPCGRVPCDGPGRGPGDEHGGWRPPATRPSSSPTTIARSAPTGSAVAGACPGRYPAAIVTGRVLPPDGSGYVPSTKIDPRAR